MSAWVGRSTGPARPPRLVRARARQLRGVDVAADGLQGRVIAAELGGEAVDDPVEQGVAVVGVVGQGAVDAIGLRLPIAAQEAGRRQVAVGPSGERSVSAKSWRLRPLLAGPSSSCG